MGPPSTRRRSRSRETRAASLEKLNQTGSIKINKSLCVDKRTRYSVENRSASRQGSKDRGESSSWRDSEDNIDKRKVGGIHVIGKRKVLIAKVRKTVVIQPRQGKWIPVSVDNLNRKNNTDFFISLLLNTIIERNLIVSKFSPPPQAGALLSPSMYMINNNDIFMQVIKGETLAMLGSLEARGGERARRDKRPGNATLPLMFFGLVAALMVPIKGEENFGVVGYDCSDPSNIRVYDAGACCQQDQEVQGEPEVVKILQIVNTEKLSGYKTLTNKTQVFNEISIMENWLIIHVINSRTLLVLYSW